jgi:RNA polymerase sigma-70 factor, ECF subfamily
VSLRTSERLERDVKTRLEAGDHDGAATVALRGYGPQILVYLRGVLRDDDLAHDVFSRFSEKLWRSMSQFRGESAFGTWAYRIAWYAAKEYKRSQARRREDRLATDAVSKIVQEVQTSASLLYKTEARNQWTEIKESLSPAERSLLLLRVEKALPWKEVAQIMAEDGEPMAEAALRKRLERLSEKLRALAKERGLR